MSLAGNVSARRLARHGGAPALPEIDSVLKTLEDVIEREHDLGRLVAVASQLDKLASRARAKGAMPANTRPHVTLSTKYEGNALAFSVKAKEALESFGFTVYNPNTDCPHKEGDKVKGASNWLRAFRESLGKSYRTHGFVVQLQQDGTRERSDMQVAEEDMASETRKHGVPVMGIYGSIGGSEVPKALVLARNQWASGECEAQAAKVEDFRINDDGMKVLADFLAAMGAMAQLEVSWRLTALLPCLEPWHVCPPGLTALFDVPHVPCTDA